MNRYACAFTGHCPQKLPWRYDEADEGCIRLKDALAAQIMPMVGVALRSFYPGWLRGQILGLR